MFADDIVLLGEIAEHLQKKLEEQKSESPAVS